jgi:hypothetical protein
VIYETTGNKRYIYDNEGLVTQVPRFGDGAGESEMIISGIYKDPWKSTEENRELTETILITFEAGKVNENHERLFRYNLTVIYEKIEINN